MVKGGAAASAEERICWFAMARWITSFQAPSKRLAVGRARSSFTPFEVESVAAAPL